MVPAPSARRGSNNGLWHGRHREGRGGAVPSWDCMSAAANLGNGSAKCNVTVSTAYWDASSPRMSPNVELVSRCLNCWSYGVGRVHAGHHVVSDVTVQKPGAGTVDEHVGHLGDGRRQFDHIDRGTAFTTPPCQSTVCRCRPRYGFASHRRCVPTPNPFHSYGNHCTIPTHTIIY